MASQDTITISSGDEDDEVKIILVTTRQDCKRRKISDSAHAHAAPENKDEKSRDAVLRASESSPIAKLPGRATSTEILNSRFDTLPVPKRSTSAPQTQMHTTHVPTASQHTLSDTSFLGPGARPSTPNHQSSDHLGSPASSTPQQAYPTLRATSPSSRRHHFKALMSNSSVSSERGILDFGAGEVSTVNEGSRSDNFEVIRAAGLQEPFGPASRLIFSRSGVGKICQTGRKNGKSIEEAALGQSSERVVTPSPQAKSASSIQPTEGGSENPNTKGAAGMASVENTRDRPKKRKLPLAADEATIPQPRLRNRILWSTPAFKEPDNTHSRPVPLNFTTELAADGNTPRQTTSTIAQEPGTQHTRKTWSCKMYADLAQRLQEHFPFADFAKKHKRSEHEVFDLFSAVVHLPLLQKSSTGLSRVWPSGHQSVKTYRSLIKETKTVLAKEGEKEEKDARKSTACLQSAAENTPANDLR